MPSMATQCMWEARSARQVTPAAAASVMALAILREMVQVCVPRHALLSTYSPVQRQLSTCCYCTMTQDCTSL